MHSCASLKRFTVMDVDFVSVSKFFGSCLCQDFDSFFSLSLSLQSKLLLDIFQTLFNTDMIQ